MSSKHLSHLDTLRGLASLSVVVFHLSCYQGKQGAVLDPSNPVRMVAEYGAMGVYLFFVISGFVIPYSMYQGGYTLRNVGRFLLKRVTRIEPPYIVCLFLGLLQSAYFAHIWHEEFHLDINRILLHIGYLIPFTGGAYEWFNIVFWTLSIEFCYYLLMALVFPLLTKTNWLIRIPIFLAFLAGPLLTTKSEFLPVYLPVFLVGILVFLRYINQINFITWLLATLITVGVIYYKMDFTRACASLLSALGILYLKKGFKVGNWLGKISYSLYLIHGMVGVVFVSLTMKYAQTTEISYLFILIGAILSIAMSWLFYYIVERPAQRLSKQITLHQK